MEILIAIVIIILIVVIPSIKIVPQAKSYVLERLGSYSQTWGNGLHFKIPFIEKIEKMNLTSKDNLIVLGDMGLFYRYDKKRKKKCNNR